MGCEKIKNFKVIIAGEDNGYLSALKILIQKLKIEDYVIFTGSLPKNDGMLWNQYKDTDIFVSPSISNQELEGYSGKESFRLPIIPEYSTPNYHIYYLILKDQILRDSLLKYLNSKNIFSTFHYIPLHKSPMGIRLGNKNNKLPITEEYSYRLLRFPIFPELDNEMINYILSYVDKFFQKNKR